MNIIAVDDEKLALEALMSAIIKAAPDAGVHGFRNPEAVRSFLKDSGKVDVAFLDVEMQGGMNGIGLAQLLLDKFPEINIIFTTGYTNYAVKAMELHSSGYIMKPVTSARVKEELAKLRNPVEQEEQRKLKVRAFGNFEVFADGIPLNFRYQKTKELLAYLVDRRGSLCTNGEIISILWEDDQGDNSHASYLKNLRSDLLSVLDEHGFGDCIVRMRGGIGILPEKISCDYYDYLKGPDHCPEGIGFQGEYMTQYSWGEYTLAVLDQGDRL